MKRVMLAIAVLLLASTSYTLTPWRYGVVAWVQGEPNAVVLQRVQKAVQDVFSFWGQPLPESAKNWDELTQMQKGTWAKGNYDPFTAGFVPIPSADASKMWAVPLPAWNGEKILPLTLLAVANYSQVQSLAGSTAAAAFSPRNMRSDVLSLNRNPSLAVLITRSNSVVFNYRSSFLRYALDHELSHWLTTLICQRNSFIIEDVSHLLQEGFAEYTAFRLSGENRNWRISAVVWAEDDNGLSDVPFYMWYPIETSLVAFLVERDGIDGFMENFPDLVTNWNQCTSDVTPAWKAWVLKFNVDEAERAYGEASIEQLDLCLILLQPILPTESSSILRRVYTLAGSMQDIERFWELISAPVPKPTGDVWKQLQKQAHTIVWVASGDSYPGIVKMAAENEYQLSRLWAKGDWDGYYALFVKTLREVVAHYGTLTPAQKTTQ